MKSNCLVPSLFLLLLPLSASQLIVPEFAPIGHRPQVERRANRQQLPVMPPPNPSAPDSGPDQDGDGEARPAVRLADILGSHRSLTSFSSLTRLHSSTEDLLSDLGANTTVLAPLNSAIDALPRKPWEDPREYAVLGAQAYEGGDGQDRAQANLRRFVEAHLVPASPWAEGEKVNTVGGGKVWWEKNEAGKVIVKPHGVEVDKVASRVANGEVWILKGVLNYV